MIKKILVSALSLVIITTLFVGCSKAKPSTTDNDDSGKLKITATLFPQYDFAKQIAGDKAEVTMLLPRGVETHSFEPTPTDIINIGESDIFLFTGKYMEPWAQSIVDSMEDDTVHVVDISQNITLDDSPHKHEDEESEGHKHGKDPHIWTSPANAIIIAQTITDALVEEDPENEEYYKANSETYIQKLEKLDNDFADAVKNGNRTEMIFGGRFPYHYFVERYGISYMSAYDSCSSETEPSVKVMSEIINEINEKNIPVVYYQELVKPTVAESISKETGAKMLLFHSCHNVSKEDFEAGVTYLSIMEQNLNNLKEGLK